MLESFWCGGFFLWLWLNFSVHKKLWDGKSLIQKLNNSGPRIEPCGTPIVHRLIGDSKNTFPDSNFFVSYFWSRDLMLCALLSHVFMQEFSKSSSK